jgi:hypothetical protein
MPGAPLAQVFDVLLVVREPAHPMRTAGSVHLAHVGDVLAREQPVRSTAVVIFEAKIVIVRVRDER